MSENLYCPLCAEGQRKAYALLGRWLSGAHTSVPFNLRSETLDLISPTNPLMHDCPNAGQLAEKADFVTSTDLSNMGESSIRDLIENAISNSISTQGREFSDSDVATDVLHAIRPYLSSLKPATTEQIHDSRLAFEKWHEPRTAQSNPFKRNPAKPDDYWCPMVQGLWETWQACEAQHKQNVRELLADIEMASKALNDADTWMGFRAESANRLDVLLEARNKVGKALTALNKYKGVEGV